MHIKGLPSPTTNLLLPKTQSQSYMHNSRLQQEHKEGIFTEHPVGSFPSEDIRKGWTISL